MKDNAMNRVVLMPAVCLLMMGCIESQAIKNTAPFEDQSLDACLVVIVDMSGSFSTSWEDRAYNMFLDISDRYFNESMGGDCKIVIGQLSGSDKVVLFEGRPGDLRKRFRNPDELNQFLLDNADPMSSRVFDSTRKAVDYASTVSGVNEDTRLLTVIMSDMRESSGDPATLSSSKTLMVESLKRYRNKGGGLALYFVANDETPRWQAILDESGFEPGHYIIENDLVASPQLPRFD